MRDAIVRTRWRSDASVPGQTMDLARKAGVSSNETLRKANMMGCLRRNLERHQPLGACTRRPTVRATPPKSDAAFCTVNFDSET